MKPSTSPVRHRLVGEAEIDGDAARFLLLQPVGVDAGQRPHQRGLAVVDMAGGADDHGVASGRGRRARASASAIPAGSSAARAGPRNRPASALPPAAPRSSQASAWTGSLRHAGAEMIGRAEHGLRVGLAAIGGHAPPAHRLGRVARRRRAHCDAACPAASWPRRRPARRRAAPTAAPRPDRTGRRPPTSIQLSMSCAAASPCSAAARYSAAARPSSRATPSPRK